MSSNTEQVISLLNEALTLEYTLIIHYPRLSSMIKDPETRDLVSGLGSASIKHADTVAEAIVRLKGKPIWSFDAFPEQVDLVSIFQEQLAKEKMARDLHQKSAYLVPSELRDKFVEIAREEESHIKTVEEILKRLTEIKINE